MANPHAQTIHGWLTKVKSDSAKARWLSGSNKRYFTLNFHTQTFYYAHDETGKKMATPIDFYDIMHAEQLPQIAEGRRSLKMLDTNQKMEFGFIVRTRDREIRLFSSTWKESRRWVDSLNAAGSIGRSQKGLSGGLKVENSQSQSSLSTNEGSGSGSSPPSDDGSDGAAPWQAASTWDKPLNGGYAKAPWKPAPKGAPPIWAQVGQPHTGDSLPPWASGPEPGSKANADLEFASGADAFAALDALADELGPPPESDESPKKASKGMVRNARDIAALKNPYLQATLPPAAPSALPSLGSSTLPPAAPSALPSLGLLPSVAALSTAQEAEEVCASTPTKKHLDAPQQFSSVLGALPGPQQFLISDSPGKDDDEHSWDEPDAAEEAARADVITSAAEGAIQDNDWDSEPEEPRARPRQRGPSEGLGVDHSSWDSEDEAETRVARRCSKAARKKNIGEDAGMQDLDDLVGEVLDGQKRVPIHEKFSDFRCTQCDNSIIRFAGCQWAPEVDYMFIRNFHGKPEKLRPRLNLASENTAYCCQCSWKTAPSSEALKDVGADLRWRIIS